MPNDSNHDRRKRLTKGVNWDGIATEISVDLHTLEGRNAIIRKIDALGKKSPGPRTSRLSCVLKQFNRLEYPQTILLRTIISLVRTSGEYVFHDTSLIGREDMIKWDIVTLFIDGEAGKLPRLNPVSSS